MKTSQGMEMNNVKNPGSLSRNGSIDLMKFLLIISVTLYHGIKIWGSKQGVIFFNGGSAVEAFLIIAGFYMAFTADIKKREPVTYIWGRYKGFFPYHVFAFVLAFVTTIWVNGFGIKGAAGLALRSVPDFFLLSPITGIQKELSGVNGIEWYLGAMLVGMFILYPFLKKWTRQFCCYFAPLIFLFASGILFMLNDGSYIITFRAIGVICGGLIRSIAMIAAGTSVYWAVKVFRDRYNLTKTSLRAFVTAAAIICWIITFVFLIADINRSTEFAIVYFTIGAVFFSSTGISYLNRPLEGKATSWLAKLSFPMFLNQSWIRQVFLKLDINEISIGGRPITYIECMLIFVIAVVVLSIICIFVMDNIMKFIRFQHSKLLVEKEAE